RPAWVVQMLADAVRRVPEARHHAPRGEILLKPLVYEAVALRREFDEHAGVQAQRADEVPNGLVDLLRRGLRVHVAPDVAKDLLKFVVADSAGWARGVQPVGQLAEQRDNLAREHGGPVMRRLWQPPLMYERLGNVLVEGCLVRRQHAARLVDLDQHAQQQWVVQQREQARVRIDALQE